MSRLHPLLLIVICGLASSSSLAQLSAPSAPARTDRVDRVVVFSDRAEVMRTVTVTCTQGTAAATFARLPATVDVRTIRGETDGDGAVVGVSLQRVAVTESLDARVAALQHELLALDTQLASSRRAQADDDERQRSLASYGPWFRQAIGEELRQPKPDVARFEELLSMLTSETQTSSSARIARQATERRLGRERERVLAHLRRLEQHHSEPSPSVSAVVAVDCGRDLSPTVRLAYVVPQASWHPEYDLRFALAAGGGEPGGGKGKALDGKVGEGTAALTVAGVIRQASGEDWTDVEVWLSTAKPTLGGEAPLPNPLWVRGGPDVSTKTLVQAQEERAADLQRGGNAAADTASGAVLEDGGKAFVLKLPRRVTIIADGRPSWFPVDELTTKARASLVAVPALSPSVYQVASLSNPAAFPLLEGVVHVHRGRTFVGDDQIEFSAPGEPIEISLGIDDEIWLDRQDILSIQKEAGFFGSDQTIAQAWRTILRNRSDRDVVVELREQIPVSKNADIKVQIEQKATSPGFSVDAVRGHLTWKVSLKKAATETRDLAFGIAFPKDWIVN
jgi:uncharacterized protein (TIGR02231 family)